MSGIEKLRKIYEVKGPVDLRSIQALFDKEGFRVGLPGGVIVRTLCSDINESLVANGGEPLIDEEAVTKFRNKILMGKYFY